MATASTASVPVPTARRRVLAAWYVGAGLLLVAINLRMGVASVGPVLAAIERSLHLSPSAASLLTTIPVFAFGAFAFLTPVLTRRIGLHRLLGLTMAVLALGIALRLEPHGWALYGGTVLAGAAIAVANVLMPAAIKTDFAHRVGLMMGLYSTALFLSAAVASAAVVPLMTAFGGAWRPALAFWALPAALAFVVWLPRALRSPGHVRGSRRVADAPREADEPRMAALLRDPVAIAVTGFMGLQSLSYYAFLTWAPTVLQDAGVSAHTAGLMLAYSSLPGILTGITGPALARRVRPSWVPVLVVVALCVTGFVGLGVAPAAGAWLWMTLLGLGQGGAISLSLSYIVWRSPDARHTAHVSTMAQGIGYLLAGLGPLGIGLLHTVTGSWTVPIVVLVALLVVQGFAGAAASRERHVLQRRSADRQS
ncbi:CP family cyanate transporter-like MFS transporter [Curtobacterium sp. PhB130]|uniref:MFS transporter n=1 Tax=unclassified Curtobacterium TaxID=257496 RepID=UPI000F4B8B16|nr:MULTISPECIES: MFS transporter [unclassified Curtobacterium]ROS78353.1 CP family cyanate transporter-like MFS transporter [Curtobacterium sp. PhB130]TCK65329.1 CP family cyanate transporter-like MFS transporter [Curtobacterium sp. PhB136]